ncbi:MAG: peroxide stress protein YaaA [Gilvibacter sp.]
MKFVVSPAKSLDFESQLPTEQFSDPIFLKEAERLNKLLKKKSARSLSKLMSISADLGALNFERNQQWQIPFTASNARPAMFAFAGDVYRGLDAYNLSKDQMSYLQENLRILSGLYGILKPLDLMQPYRLEMGTRIKVGVSKNLYAFWQKKITQALNNELKEDDFLLNLASNEYFKAIDKKTLNVPIINTAFKEFKDGEYKMIGFFAKYARGLMAKYLATTNAKTLEDVKGFNYEGYGFSEALSTEQELVFTRQSQ